MPSCKAGKQVRRDGEAGSGKAVDHLVSANSVTRDGQNRPLPGMKISAKISKDI